MPFPQKLLTPGEQLLVETRPNWSVLVLPVIVSLLVIGAAVAIAVVWSTAPVIVDYVLVAICVLAVVWFLCEVAAWRARLLVVTTTRVVYRWGVVRRTGRQIPLERIQDVTYEQSLLERIIGAGSLTIESAGRSGDEPFPDVRRPAELQSLINQLISELAQRNRLGWVLPGSGEGHDTAVRGRDYDTAPTPIVAQSRASSPSGATAASGDLAAQLRDIERLHESGVLTDAEFDASRRRLLGMD